MKRAFFFVLALAFLFSNVFLLPCSADSDLSFLENPPGIPPMGMPDGSDYNYGTEDRLQDDIDEIDDNIEAITDLSSSPDDNNEDAEAPLLDVPDLPSSDSSDSSDSFDSSSEPSSNSFSTFSTFSSRSASSDISTFSISDSDFPFPIDFNMLSYIDVKARVNSSTLSSDYKRVIFLRPYAYSSDRILGTALYFNTSSCPDLVYCSSSDGFSWSGSRPFFKMSFAIFNDNGDISFGLYNSYDLTNDHFSSSDQSITTSYLYHTDIPLDFNGTLVEPDEPLVTPDCSITVDENHDCTISISYDSDKSLSGSFGIYNNKTEPSEATRISYSPVDSACSFSVSRGSPFSFTFNLDDFKDVCRDKPSFTFTIYVSISFYDMDLDDFYTEINLKELDTLFPDDSLFDDELDYQDFPDIEDYTLDFPDFPTFDPDHPLDSIWEIVKWIGECLIIIGKNLIGFFKWLWACLKVLLNNIITALYNLVVKLRRLLTYLFVPSKKVLSKSVEDNFPMLSSLIDRFRSSSFTYSGFTIYLLGNSYSFNPVDHFSPDTLSVFRNISNILILAVGCFAVYNIIRSFFGLNSGDSNGD